VCVCVCVCVCVYICIYVCVCIYIYIYIYIYITFCCQANILKNVPLCINIKIFPAPKSMKKVNSIQLPKSIVNNCITKTFLIKEMARLDIEV